MVSNSPRYAQRVEPQKGGGVSKEIKTDWAYGVVNAIYEPKPVDFCCPICQSTKFTDVTKNNGILGPGGHVWVAYRVCLGCSVMFTDPERFGRVRA